MWPPVLPRVISPNEVHICNRKKQEIECQSVFILVCDVFEVRTKSRMSVAHDETMLIK